MSKLNEAVRAAILALTADVEPGQHGQLCPVWTQRYRKLSHEVQILEHCDCWVSRNARHNARVVIEAAAPALGVSL